MTAFAKCRVKGPGAEDFLDYLVANKLPKKIGRIGLCHRSEEHTSEPQSRLHLVCRLLLEKKKKGILSSHRHRSTRCSCITGSPLGRNFMRLTHTTSHQQTPLPTWNRCRTCFGPSGTIYQSSLLS